MKLNYPCTTASAASQMSPPCPHRSSMILSIATLIGCIIRVVLCENNVVGNIFGVLRNENNVLINRFELEFGDSNHVVLSPLVIDTPYPAPRPPQPAINFTPTGVGLPGNNVNGCDFFGVAPAPAIATTIAIKNNNECYSDPLIPRDTGDAEIATSALVFNFVPIGLGSREFNNIGCIFNDNGYVFDNNIDENKILNEINNENFYRNAAAATVPKCHIFIKTQVHHHVEQHQHKINKQKVQPNVHHNLHHNHLTTTCKKTTYICSTNKFSTTNSNI